MSNNIAYILTIAVVWGLGMAFIPYSFREVVGTFHDRRQDLLQLSAATTMWTNIAALSIGAGALVWGRLTGSSSEVVSLMGWGLLSAFAALILGVGLSMQRHARLSIRFLGTFVCGGALGGWVILTAKQIAQAFA